MNFSGPKVLITIVEWAAIAALVAHFGWPAFWTVLALVTSDLSRTLVDVLHRRLG